MSLEPDRSHETLFIAELSVSAPLQSSAKALARWPGLKSLTCVVHVDGKTCKVVSAWLTKRHYDAAEAPFIESLAAGAEQIWSGFRLSQAKADADKTLWEQLKTGYVYLVTVVAVLGTLAALSDYYASLWGEPVVQLVGDVELDLLEESDAEIAVASSNVGTHEAHVVWTSARASNERIALSRNLHKESIVHPKIAVGSSETMKLPIRTSTAGTFEITLAGAARSGLFRSSQSLSRTIGIRVWQALEIHEPLSLRDMEHDRHAECLLRVDTGVARADGVAVTAQLERASGVSFMGVIGPSADQKRDANADLNAEVAKLEWRTNPLEALKSHQISVHLKSEVPRTEKQWEETCRAIQLQY